MTLKRTTNYAFIIFALTCYSLFSQTAVEKHGRLQVNGNKIVDKTNTPVSLAGNSLFWSNAGDTSDFYNTKTINYLADNWNSSIIRAAMGVNETWDAGRGYINSPEAQKIKIQKVIDAAIANGIYVIVDWHTHEAEKYEEEAITFFQEIAELYGNHDNIIYEIYNEPIRQSWQEVKSYATQVIAAIRAKDPDNLIVVGSPTWSQDVDVASQNPISDVNTAYTLHFYSGTHTQFLRDKAQTALNNGIALFVTEWGAVNADGNGNAAVSETEAWMEFLSTNAISHVNWAVSDKPEGASIVNDGKGVNGLENDDLTETGRFIKTIIENWSDGVVIDNGADEQPHGIINCNTADCILNAMKFALPGDEIIVAPGTYIALEKDNTDGRASRFFSAADGTAAQPITIRAENPSNPPVLKAPEGSYDGYVMRILGDYWRVKDIIMEDGSKGLVFDNANHGIIENITVRDIGEEGIHLRDGSSNNVVRGCNVSHTGVKKPGFGEGLYVGSDRSQHDSTYNPDCNDNILENCIVGPYVAAESVDVKEGTLNTIIRGCTFSAKGITGENSADAFIDLKGAYTFVYNNTFNLDGSTVINSAIDFQDRKTDYNTGFRNAIFNNVFNLGSGGADIPSMRAKGGSPSEIHFWNNTRVPNTPDPTSDFSLKAMVLSCPSWNILPCEDNQNNNAPSVAITSPANGTQYSDSQAITITANATDSDGAIAKVEFYSNAVKLGETTSLPYQYTIASLALGNYTITVRATDNEGATAEDSSTITISNSSTQCTYSTPSNTALPTFDDVAFTNAHVTGGGGLDLSNLRRFRIDWNASSNTLRRFAINTSDGVPSYYVDLKAKMVYSFNTANPELTITNSGISGLDGAYWVTEDNGNFVMVSKQNTHSIYFNNADTAPNCSGKSEATKAKYNATTEVLMYPNPVSNGMLTITNIPERTKAIHVLDLQGKIIIKKAMQHTSTTTLNVSQLKTGLYVVALMDGAVQKSILLSKK